MPGFWLRPLSNLGLIALLALIIWPIAGAVWALLGFSLFLLGYILLNLRQLKALNRWLANPQLRTVPEGEGLWKKPSFCCISSRGAIGEPAVIYKALQRFQRAGEPCPTAW